MFCYKILYFVSLFYPFNVLLYYFHLNLGLFYHIIFPKLHICKHLFSFLIKVDIKFIPHLVVSEYLCGSILQGDRGYLYLIVIKIIDILKWIISRVVSMSSQRSNRNRHILNFVGYLRIFFPLLLYQNF